MKIFQNNIIFQYLPYLSFRKVLNGCLVSISYFISRLVKHPVVLGYPIAVSIEPTSLCNLQCPQCPTGTRSLKRPSGFMDISLFQKILSEIKKTSFHITLYFQGEPFMHTQIIEFIQLAQKQNIFTMTSTNGHFLNREISMKIIHSGLQKLIISVDGTSQETYEKYRVGGNLAKVLKNIEELIVLKNKYKKSTPFVIVQFLVFKWNEHEIEQMKTLCEKLNVDKLELKSAQLYETEKIEQFAPKNTRYSRYTKTKNAIRIKSNLLNHCWKMWHSCVFTWDGELVPCCFDKHAQFSFGNIKSSSMKEIWKNKKYNKFRMRILHDRKSISICTNCTEGLKKKY